MEYQIRRTDGLFYLVRFDTHTQTEIPIPEREQFDHLHEARKPLIKKTKQISNVQTKIFQSKSQISDGSQKRNVAQITFTPNKKPCQPVTAPLVKELPQQLKDFVLKFNSHYQQNFAEKNMQPQAKIEKVKDFSQFIKESKENFVLFPHQKKCFETIKEEKRECIIALDMGLGKTGVMIALFLFLHEVKPLRALVVLPVGLISQWRDEITQFAPKLTVRVIQNSKTACFSEGSNIILISVDLVARVKKDILASPKFDVLVLDEAQSVKDITTERSKALAFIIGNAHRVYLLSGTPSMEHVFAFGLLHLLHPLFKHFFHYQNFQLQSDKFYFADRYLSVVKKPIGKGQTAWDFKRNVRKQELKALMSPFLIRMKMKNVVDLPPVVRETIVVGELNKKQTKEFAEKLVKIDSLREKNSMAANAMMMELVRETMRLKTPFVVRHIKMLLETQPKLSCFLHHHYLSDEIQNMLNANGIEFININSKVSRKKRAELIEDFKVKPNIRVAILSFGCCAFGLNLTCVRVNVFCEDIWEADKKMQAEARSARIGQTESVNIQYLKLKGSTDVLLEKSNNRKLNTQAFLLGDLDEE